ncbi:uncharacterized protein B0H18DRAFT_952490 [Fomitopsis serialis]|uniref:uncharacterized protein n=1 Tax=Fomitopsis serialis TaxID=139415 RepID=UPI002007F56D|nr:uncharacterized protein B0H18DRAFT_952490 [Neoantrodia serialis]KAH9931791.1 hypothetical protein B0H18DRAFT_952490 [Neoantrodia serialis]
MPANYKAITPPPHTPHPPPAPPLRQSSPPPPPTPSHQPAQAATDPPHAASTQQGDAPQPPLDADAHSPEQPKRINADPAPPQSAPPYPDHHWHPHPYAFHPVYTYPPPHPDYHHYRLMPHRVEADRHSAHHPDDGHYPRMHSQPTPPPIATLHHSPAMSTSSLASSSISPSPPASAAGVPPQGGYTYAPQGAPSARYAPQDAPSPYAHGGTGLMRTVRPTYGAHAQPAYPGQPNYIIYTNDAATKLSDRVRRKCYNCHTTDTSTWRRSSLTPGKVLCNKCGLFERTHSRPRPDQFPHKRGPLVTASFKSSTRSPPPGSAGRLPPMAAAHAHHHHHGGVQAFPPHHANHASIAPLMSQREGGQPQQQQYYAQDQQGQAQVQVQDGQGNASTLPEIRSLLNTPAGGSPASVSVHEGVDGQAQQTQVEQVEGSPRERREVYRAQA